MKFKTVLTVYILLIATTNVASVLGKTWRGACTGKWPDPGILGNCARSCTTFGIGVTTTTEYNESSGDIFLTNFLPGNGQDYSCRYKVTKTSSVEGGCAGVVPTYSDVTVLALSKYRKLSPCHIQSAWIVSSTYERTKYGYPKVRLAPENISSLRNWSDTFAGRPSSFCSQGVKKYHSFVCFYPGYCHVITNPAADAYNNCYYLNGTHKGGELKRAGAACDYTVCKSLS